MFENVIEHKNSVCGAYIDPTVAFPAPGATFPVKFTAKIYVNDFLALQIFDDWPTMFGNILLKDILFTINTMVCAQVDPHAVARRENFINETVTDADLNLILNTHFKYGRKFTQGSLPGEFITSVRKVGGDIQYVTEPVVFSVRKWTLKI